jgi:hypothetical protein
LGKASFDRKMTGIKIFFDSLLFGVIAWLFRNSFLNGHCGSSGKKIIEVE